MAPKVINNKVVSEVVVKEVKEVKEVLEVVKAKRGRKSKKDLMASLNMELIVKDKDKNISNN